VDPRSTGLRAAIPVSILHTYRSEAPEEINYLSTYHTYVKKIKVHHRIANMSEEYLYDLKWICV
jgi:hypothetical protein